LVYIDSFVIFFIQDCFILNRLWWRLIIVKPIIYFDIGILNACGFKGDIHFGRKLNIKLLHSTLVISKYEFLVVGIKRFHHLPHRYMNMTILIFNYFHRNTVIHLSSFWLFNFKNAQCLTIFINSVQFQTLFLFFRNYNFISYILILNFSTLL
jgi:hypothetical protein